MLEQKRTRLPTFKLATDYLTSEVLNQQLMVIWKMNTGPDTNYIQT